MGKFLIRKTNTGWNFHLKAGNGETIATSEVYNTLRNCKNGCASVARNAAIAALEDQTQEGFTKAKNPKFEIYLDKKGEFRFRLKARNGEIIAASEGYTSLSGCQNGIESVRKNAPDAPIVVEEG